MYSVRPFGINTFAISQIFFASLTIIVSLAGAISLLAIYGLLTSETGYEELEDLLTEETLENTMIKEFVLVSAISFVLLFLIGIAGIIAAVGLLKTKIWSRRLIIYLSMGVLALNVIIAVLEVSLGMLNFSWVFYVYLVWFFLKITFYAFLIEYFTKPMIKKYFKEEDEYDY